MTNSEERAISLKLKNCHTNPGSLVIVFRSGTQSDPCISSVATSIMITSSDSPLGSGTPNQLLGVRLHTALLREAHAFQQVDVARVGVKGLEEFFGFYIFHATRPLRVGLFQPLEGMVTVFHQRIVKGDLVG
jgi:hypothetical protein